MKNNKLKLAVLLCLLFTSSINVFADDIEDGNGNGDVSDVQTAPIDNYLPLLLIASIGLSYVLLRKKSINK